MAEQDPLEPSERAPEQEAWANPDRAALKSRVRDLQRLMAVFLKAGKTLRLYSEDHRYFNRFADEFEGRLEEQFAHSEALTFEITPTSINWEGHVVFENAEQRENLAFKLYRDGVRLLQFRRGASASEVRDFVTLIAREVDRASAGQDLSVLFWEADFKHIHIAVAETFVEYDDAATKALGRLELDLGALVKDFGVREAAEIKDLEELKKHWDGSAGGGYEASNAHLGGGGEKYVPCAIEALDGAPLSQPSRRGDPRLLGGGGDETDLPALPAEAMDDFAMELVYADLHGLERAYASFEEVGGVLSHVIEAEPDAEELTAFLDNLDDALSPLLATASVGPLNSLLRRIAMLQRREAEAGSFRWRPLAEFLRKVGVASRLSVLARAVNEDWNESLKGELFTFISLQVPENIPEIMEFLGQLFPEEPRRVVLDAVVLLAERHPAPFVQALHSPNPRLVADAVRALGIVGDRVTLDQTVAVFTRPESAVRLQVLETLRAHQSPRIHEMVLRALDDDESSVRLAALRYCAVHRQKDALPSVQQTVAARGFKDRSFEERRGWVMTLGMLSGSEILAPYQATAEAGLRRADHGEETHLALLLIRSVRETAARSWLQEFANRATGEVKLLAHKVLAGNR